MHKGFLKEGEGIGLSWRKEEVRSVLMMSRGCPTRRKRDRGVLEVGRGMRMFWRKKEGQGPEEVKRDRGVLNKE